MKPIPYTFEESEKEILVTDGSPERPLVLLLHGTGDTEVAWRRPEQHPDHTYDYDAPFPANRRIGWRFYPGVGIWSFELDPTKQVTSWTESFQRHGFATARYTQVDNTGLLARPVRELGVVMDKLTTEFPSARIVVLTQSRGGILIRQFIKDNFGDAARVGQITMVITLHGPHAGSALANISTDVTAVIDDLRSALPDDIVDASLGWLEQMVNFPAFQELRVGGAFLKDLAAGEQALPGVGYHTFGGTSVKVTRVRSWVYTLGSAIPKWNLPPFDHEITMVEAPVASPLLNSLPNLTEEVTEGEGDILVAERRAHLPWSVRHSNRINHAETYWNPELQAQVLRLLGEDITFWS